MLMRAVAFGGDRARWLADERSKVHDVDVDDKRTIILAGAIVVAALIIGLSLFFALRTSEEEACLQGGGTWIEDSPGGAIGMRPGCHHF